MSGRGERSERSGGPAGLRGIRRRAVPADAGELVRFEDAVPGAPLPIQATAAGDLVDAAGWAEENRQVLEERLQERGAVLLRGFGVAGTEELERLVTRLYDELLRYTDRVQPRTQVHRNVYTSTEYPPDQTIELHNESSYASEWPLRLFFLCEQPAPEGGATPVADGRRIAAGMDPEVRRRFEDKGILYVRNFGHGMGITWQEAYGTEDRDEMAAFCRRHHIELEWLDDGRLRTRARRPAFRRHPRTGELAWFNAALSSHVSTLDPEVREALLAELAPEDLPKNVYFGDGTPLGEEDLAEVRRLFRQESVEFQWQRGDVLLVDNMLAMHGRTPYRGPRKVVVAMAVPVRADDLDGDGGGTEAHG